jgi:hypothetical protein
MSSGFEHIKYGRVRQIGSIELKMVVMYRFQPDQMDVSCRGQFPCLKPHLSRYIDV